VTVSLLAFAATPADLPGAFVAIAGAVVMVGAAAKRLS
jgi:hypothetical protein